MMIMLQCRVKSQEVQCCARYNRREFVTVLAREPEDVANPNDFRILFGIATVTCGYGAAVSAGLVLSSIQKSWQPETILREKGTIVKIRPEDKYQRYQGSFSSH